MIQRKQAGTVIFAAGIILLGAVSPLRGEPFQWGRKVTPGRSFSLEMMGGAVTRIYGKVKETSRPYYEMIGKEAEGHTYTLSELGLDKNLFTWGGRLEQRWKYLSVAFSASYMKFSSSTTAKEDFYIGISDRIEYQGKEYDYMMIPEGHHFTADYPAALLDLQFLITPLTWQPAEALQISPWLCLDLFGFFGKYDLNAGPPTGTTFYEYPPQEYVVGGHSQDWIGMGVPGIGPGGEIILGKPGGVRLALEANAVFFKYSGSSDSFPVKVSQEKDVDLDYYNLVARGRLEVPLSDEVDFLVGLSYQYILADVSTRAQEHTPEEIEELREKWDKDIDFNFSIISLDAGLRF